MTSQTCLREVQVTGTNYFVIPEYVNYVDVSKVQGENENIYSDKFSRKRYLRHIPDQFYLLFSPYTMSGKQNGSFKLAFNVSSNEILNNWVLVIEHQVAIIQVGLRLCREF